MNIQSFLKRLSIIDFITVLIIYIIALTTESAQGYELNIYTMYSPIFWILFFSVIVISITILVLSEFWKNANYWKNSIFSIIMLYCIFLLLPLIRGYYMFARGSCDVFTHLSWAQNLLNTGLISTYYPISHILLADFHFAGLNLDTSAYLFPVVFTGLLILFLSILGRSFNKGSWVSLFPVLFSLPLLYGMFHRTFHPFIYALFFIPLFFYILFKSFNYPEMKQYPILLIIVSFFIVFMHPLITLMLIAFTLAIYVTNNITIHDPGRKSWNNRLIFISSILAISFCLWYLSFRATLTSIRSVFFALLDQTDSVETILESQTTLIASSDAHLLYIIRLFLLNYGPLFSYLLLGLFFCIFVFTKVKENRVPDIQLIFSIQFLLGLLFAVIFTAGYFILVEPIRAAAGAILIATIFIPIVLTGIISEIQSVRTKKIVFSVFAVFLVIIVTISILNIFASPIISQSSWHMTYMEKDGLDWFLKTRDNTVPVILFESTLSYRKYENYFSETIYHPSISPKDKIIYSKTIPSGFGYDNYTRITDTLDNKEYYYLSTELNRQGYLVVPEDRRAQLSKITSADFKRLKQDNSINLLYSNGEFESWWIPWS